MIKKTITPVDVSVAVSIGRGILLDVRTAAEFREVHAADAKLVPLDILDRARVAAARGTNSGLVYLVCASGIRSVKAADLLNRTGFKDVQVVEGGMNAWITAGLPVIRGRKTLSLERQVRIGAGLLVLAGTCLGWFVHPGFFILTAFVGGGLAFAGITDICGMATLLAKAPWNRTRKASCAVALAERQPAAVGTSQTT